MPRNIDKLLVTLTYGGRRGGIVSVGRFPRLADEEQIVIWDENGRIAWRNMDGSLVNLGFVKQQMRHPEVQAAINEARGRSPDARVDYNFTSSASLEQIEQMEGRPLYGFKGHPYHSRVSGKRDITDSNGWMGR